METCNSVESFFWPTPLHDLETAQRKWNENSYPVENGILTNGCVQSGNPLLTSLHMHKGNSTYTAKTLWKVRWSQCDDHDGMRGEETLSSVHSLWQDQMRGWIGWFHTREKWLDWHLRWTESRIYPARNLVSIPSLAKLFEGAYPNCP